MFIMIEKCYLNQKLIMIIVLLFIQSILCQDLQFRCITCRGMYDQSHCKYSLVKNILIDRQLKCDLECALTYQSSGTSTVDSCIDDCQTTYEQCSDSTNALSCATCSTACAATYDASLRKCLLSISRSMDYSTEFSSCEQCANNIMETCMQDCDQQYR